MRGLIVLIVCWATILVCGFSEGYVGQKTEEKYLRNLSKYRMINDHHFYIGFNGGDTLTFIAKTSFQQIDPFHKWYISDVGQIKPWGKLSKALDSIAATYVEPANKYK